MSWTRKASCRTREDFPSCTDTRHAEFDSDGDSDVHSQGSHELRHKQCLQELLGPEMAVYILVSVSAVFRVGEACSSGCCGLLPR
eukprot:scaffold1374_cov157-Pinguiococcus_pyrenoidosus.AAC.1